MLRTAERYFDVVFAQESLTVSHQQELSVKKALDEANARYKLGDIPVTDTHEAAARMEAIKAQSLAADAELQLKQAALMDATGLNLQQLAVPKPGDGDLAAPLASLESWLSDVSASNPDLLIQKKRVAVANEQSARSGVLASPSLDLVGELSREHLTGSGDYGVASNASRAALIGIQLTIPLYSGGMRSAKHDESDALARKALIEANRAQQQMVLQARSAWLGLTVGKGRVAALAASLKASEARLNATRLGRQVGDRSTLDLLNAENDAANARLSLMQARIGLIMDRLRLCALAGALNEDQLLAVNLSLK
jgi:outer membrane protein